jgi:hypothetical protein
MVSRNNGTFASTICAPSPALGFGIERDDNKFSTADLEPGAAILWAQSAHETPDREYLIKYPQGLWSGKSVAAGDYNRVPGFGGRSWPTPQDMKALANLGEQFAEFSAHIPDLRLAEELYEGHTVANPYRNGSRDAGRESSRMVDVPDRYNSLLKRGAHAEHLSALATKVIAQTIRAERENTQKEALAEMTRGVAQKKALINVPGAIPGASERFRWQVPVIPAAPLNTSAQMIESVVGRK